MHDTRRIATPALAMASALALLLTTLFTTETAAQTKITENTLRLDADQQAPAARVEQLAWLTGVWRGEGLGGEVEEVWATPSAGVMIGGFQLNREGAPAFYEFLTIAEDEGSLVLRLKHFDPPLSSWEEKEDFVAFPLVAIEERAAFFRGLTYRLEDDRLHIFLAMRQGDESREVPFVLTRAPSTGTPSSR